MNYLFHSPVDDLAGVAVPEGALLLNWIGQAGFLVKGAAGKTLCIDPYLSNSIEKYEGLEARRMWWPSFSMERFRPDAVFVTHDHIDHADPETLPLIEAYARPERYFAPPSAVEHIGAMGVRPAALQAVSAGDRVEFHDMVLRPVFAKHTADSVGLILEAAGLKVYFTGDTCWCEELLDVADEHVDILVACINGIYRNLNIDEACTLAKVLGVKLTIPMHFGVVPCNTARPERFLRRSVQAGLVGLVLKPEEHYLFSRRDGAVVYEKL